MKLMREESFQKNKQMLGCLQKNISGGSRPLGTKCNQEKCQGKLA